jgi:hypothetical protein
MNVDEFSGELAAQFKEPFDIIVENVLGASE